MKMLTTAEDDSEPLKWRFYNASHNPDVTGLDLNGTLDGSLQVSDLFNPFTVTCVELQTSAVPAVSHSWQHHQRKCKLAQHDYLEASKEHQDLLEKQCTTSPFTCSVVCSRGVTKAWQVWGFVWGGGGGGGGHCFHQNGMSVLSPELPKCSVGALPVGCRKATKAVKG